VLTQTLQWTRCPFTVLPSVFVGLVGTDTRPLPCLPLTRRGTFGPQGLGRWGAQERTLSCVLWADDMLTGQFVVRARELLQSRGPRYPCQRSPGWRTLKSARPATCYTILDRHSGPRAGQTSCPPIFRFQGGCAAPLLDRKRRGAFLRVIRLRMSVVWRLVPGHGRSASGRPRYNSVRAGGRPG